jgi:hypothetical protein
MIVLVWVLGEKMKKNDDGYFKKTKIHEKTNETFFFHKTLSHLLILYFGSSLG